MFMLERERNAARVGVRGFRHHRSGYLARASGAPDRGSGAASGLRRRAETGRCMDNAFIERLWRSLKHEAVYLHDIADSFEGERVIADWIGFYNELRSHSSLGGRTPADAYFGAALAEAA